VLRILRGAGGEGLPTLAIGERLIEQAPGMTRLLDRLEAKRLIRRKRCAKDRRQVLCWITPAGLRLLDRLDEVIAQPEQRLARVWSESQARTIISLLDRGRAAAGQPDLPQTRSRQRS
jgi:DNA-binding MarR family transcriptional regulator